MYPIIDIGINILNHHFKNDKEMMLQRAVSKGVYKMILTGVSLSNSKATAQFIQDYPKVLYGTAGIHPHHAKEFQPKDIPLFKTLLQNPQMVAVGECGLDFDRNFSTPQQQETCFRAQIELAIETQKPMFLHERAAHQRFVSILQDYQNQLPKCVVHCFTGSVAEVHKYLEMDFYIGITGAITNPKFNYLADVIWEVPENRLMIETDAPFMMPRNIEPKPNHRRNEPMYLPFVLKYMADILEISTEEFAEQSTATALEFFDIKD